MPKDIRKMLENYSEKPSELSTNHNKRFEERLFKELHSEEKKKRPVIQWLSIAASIVLLVTLGVKFIDFGGEIETEDPVEKKLTLGSISPDLNTIESYYINSINLELSELEVTDENKELLNDYLEKIGELTKEYKSLTEELNTKGVNDQTIDALISNLRLRLQLLQRLKKQLNDFKKLNLKQNEIQQV
ncbi:hypothetical protein RQM59_06680 [Flavobacteriaceae bacterium S356]|uniref:Uncharacterized protein n=1 Tax=Asprobacillus argus TaxID=3076534 RepID=A0ABU3LFZ7_9FLAO|nr:hypothetical protein [Flavobacteriaceae bacterium S356]